MQTYIWCAYILVSNKFFVCCDTYILIADTIQYYNVHIKQNSKTKSKLFGCIEKSTNTKGAY